MTGKAPAIGLLVRILVLVLVVLVPVLAADVPQGAGAAAFEPGEQVGREEAALVLAVEAPGAEPGGQLPGPEPNLQNSFAPEEYEIPWTWWLGVILTVVAVLIVVGFGLAYYVLIHRPRQRILQP